SKAAECKRSGLCRLPSLPRSHRARSISWCGALPGDREGAAPRASPSPQSSSASSSKSRSPSVPAGLRAPPCSLASLLQLLRLPLRIPQFSFAQHRLDPREIALRFPQLLQTFALSGRKWERQPENRHCQPALLGFKPGLAHLAVLSPAPRVSFRHYSSSPRLTNFVF